MQVDDLKSLFGGFTLHNIFCKLLTYKQYKKKGYTDTLICGNIKKGTMVSFMLIYADLWSWMIYIHPIEDLMNTKIKPLGKDVVTSLTVTGS